MDPVEDIIIKDDLQFKDGDLLVSASDEQHVEHIIKADNGHFRQWPLVGVGSDKYRGGPFNRQKVAQEISLQLRSDNYQVRSVDIKGEGSEFTVAIDAKRLK